ncbi:HAD family hydrolase [Trinickia violacea]|uniref:D,D-heptose 1,7-bisphosphate phosphatase n=1 Tax=Trinickia violacea TaxID=2571746 RepID=A0A4P8IP06_9BURK|nr:HAD family hydrolase [Trinickia violacea]QCP50768.1 HAD family hydrolase [Trinickia violacea]
MAELKRALFLDRDGVINVDIGYLHRPGDCVFLPGIFELVRNARQAGYDVFVVTNQAGIARGYYSEQTFAEFTAWMLEKFAAEGAPITQVYHCPHHPTAGIGEYKRECECRKPAPGMLLRAVAEHAVDVNASVMVGDSVSDMEAAKAAGVKHRFLIGGENKAQVSGDFISIAELSQVAKSLHWI